MKTRYYRINITTALATTTHEIETSYYTEPTEILNDAYNAVIEQIGKTSIYDETYQDGRVTISLNKDDDEVTFEIEQYDEITDAWERVDDLPWYAVKEANFYDDSYGSMFLDKAVEMLKEQGEGYIAILDPEDAFCLDTIGYYEATGEYIIYTDKNGNEITEGEVIKYFDETYTVNNVSDEDGLTISYQPFICIGRADAAEHAEIVSAGQDA